MKNKKLFNLLRLLTKEELIRFGEYVRSPFFNKNQKAILLWDLLEKHGPTFHQEILRQYETYIHIYDKPVSIETVFRYSTRLLEDFLVQIRQREDHYYKKYLLLDELLRLGSPRDFNSQYKAVSGRQKVERRRGARYYYLKFLMESVKFDSQKLDGASDEELAMRLEEIIDNLDAFYLCNKVDLSGKLAILQGKSTADKALLADLEAKLSNGWLNEIPVAYLQHLLLHCALKGRPEDFENLVNIEDAVEAAVPKSTLQTAYLQAAHFCLLKSEENQGEYWLPLFSLCQKVLDQPLPKNYEMEAPLWVSHLVNIGCQLEVYKETRELLQRFKYQLSPESREFDYPFYLGFIYLKEKNYEEATHYFKAARSFTAHMGIAAHAYLLRIFFEKDEVDFPHMLKEFSMRTQKAKLLSKAEREAYLQYVKVLSALFKRKSGIAVDTAVLKDMIEDIPLEYRDWILGKLD